MLLVAVTGSVGSGKTTRLAELAEWARAEGRRVDGFVAYAERRAEATRGAARYDLEWVATGQRTPFAHRVVHRSSGVPYAFDPQTAEQVRAWADGLGDRTPGLVVLDEFGRAEAEGQGHAEVWPLVKAADPSVVVIAVREGLVEQIEQVLGQPFDACLEARDPATPAALRALCADHDDWARIGAFGAGAGGIEATAGAALHAARIPLRGLGLSTVQAVVMTLAGDGLRVRPRVVWVPFVSAGLKTLSPAGNRLRPMLAITVQGILFAGAVRVLGWTRTALFAAGALVGAWAAAQGLVLQYLLVGDELAAAAGAVAGWADARGWGLPGLWTLVVGWIGLWALVAGSVTAWAFRRSSVGRRAERMVAQRAEQLPVRAPSSAAGAARGALADLARPAFWLPIALIAGVVLAAGAPWERVVWIGVRAATVGFLLFAAVRLVDPLRAAGWLRRRGRWGPAEALDRALGGRGGR
jgi:nucleoside-triphosphatase THEP1